MAFHLSAIDPLTLERQSDVMELLTAASDPLLADPNDPETSPDIVSLGLVRAVQLDSGDVRVQVELPPEANATPGMCGLLRRHMYGTRRAAEGRQDEYSATLWRQAFCKVRRQHASSRTRRGTYPCLCTAMISLLRGLVLSWTGSSQ